MLLFWSALRWEVSEVAKWERWKGSEVERSER